MKFKNEDEATRFFAAHSIDITKAKSGKDKKGNILYTLSQSEEFTLSHAEKKESKRTP